VNRVPRLVAFLSLVVICVLAPRSLSVADPVGSPASSLRKGQWMFGLGTGGVVNRGAKGAGDPEQGLYRIEHFRGYGLTDWLSIYAKVGWAYLRVEDGTSLDGANDFGSNLLLGAQLKSRLWQNAKKNWEWNGSIQYLWVGAPHRRNKNQGEWQEWQVATTTARAFGRLKPYVGVKYSLVDFDFKVRKSGETIQSGTYKQEGRVGPVLGTDYLVGEDVIVNVESAYIDGAEVTVAVAHAF
jgi:hypothetical protein